MSARRTAAASDLARAGGADAPIELVAYDPAWPQRFAAEREIVQRVLEPWLRGTVEHIGSTAVPGLAAKPVIDLMAPVAGLARTRREAVPRLVAEAGYAFPEAFNDALAPTGRVFGCKPPHRERTHHLHLVEAGSRELARHLAFRDALRSDPDLRAAYEALKRDLATRFRHDREGYAEAKTEFVRGVEARVLRA